MDRRATVVAAVVAVVVVALSVAAWAKHSSSSSGKLAMALVSIDRAQRLVHVELRGFNKAPPGNFFSMTDDRGRHYIAQTVRCAPAGAPLLSCALEIPDGYERHPLVSLELHVRGLHSRTIAVPAEVVSEAWLASLGYADGGVTDQATTPRTP
jgi:hypothetical protein